MFTPPPPNCPLCPRLVAFREGNALQFPHFFNGSVPPFGDLNAQLLVVGLAPGLKGANASGRPFTGDFAGDVLYSALAKHGFASGTYDPAQLMQKRNDGFTLHNVRITNAVRCVPPENKPTPLEEKTCNPFLINEIAAMPNLKLILSLGLTSHQAVLRTFKLKVKDYKFAHGAAHELVASRQSPVASEGEACAVVPLPLRERLGEGALKVSASPSTPLTQPSPARGEGFAMAASLACRPSLTLLDSYHTSRYNISTGRLTQAMFDAVVEKAKALLG